MQHSDKLRAPRFATLTERHLAEAERIVARQQKFVARLHEQGRPAELAEVMLETLTTTLGLMRARRAGEQRLASVNGKSGGDAPEPVPDAASDVDHRIEVLRAWVAAQAVTAAELRASGLATKDADEHLQALQRCLDAAKVYRRVLDRDQQRALPKAAKPAG